MVVESCIPLADRDEWDAVLETIPHGFGHTWGNCHAMAQSTGHHTYLYTAEADGNRIVCAIAEREYDGCLDIYTPLGFSGFAGRAHPAFAESWTEFVTKRGYVCGYFELNPILGAATCFNHADLTYDRSAYVLDLRRSRAQLLAEMSRNRRRQLIGLESDAMPQWFSRKALADFLSCSYPAFVRERSASSTYDLTPETLRSLCALDRVFLIGAGQNGAVEAVSVFAYTSSIGEYLFNVSAPAGRHFSAVLLWAGIAQLQSIGIPLLNLGGGVQEGDGVARFKKRFGGLRQYFGRAKQVYRPEVYERLCRTAGVDYRDRNGYFPAYRQKQHHGSPARYSGK